MYGGPISALVGAVLQASSLTGGTATITEPGGVSSAAALEIAPVAKPADGLAHAPLLTASYSVRSTPSQAYTVEQPALLLRPAEPGVILPLDISTVRQPTGDRRVDNVKLQGSVTVPPGTPAGVYAGQVVVIINYN